MMSIHQSYEDCVKETIENQTFLIWGYLLKYTFELFKQKFERLLLMAKHVQQSGWNAMK